MESVHAMAVNYQAGHHDIKMTLKYRHQKKVNEHMQGVESGII